MDIPDYIPGITMKDIEEEAARVMVDVLTAELGKALGKITLLEGRLASARSVLDDTASRLNEEIDRANEATDEANLVAAHSTTLIETNRELRQRVRQLEGFLYLCRGHFATQGQSSWAEEAGRVLRGEKA